MQGIRNIGRKDEYGLPPALLSCKIAEGREYFYLTLRFRKFCYMDTMFSIDFYRSTWGKLTLKVRLGKWDLWR